MKQNEKIAVAVYGTLLTSCRADGLLPEARRTVFLRGRLYDTRRGYPTFAPDPDSPNLVRAEVAEVDRETLARLDRYEGYPTLYRRAPVRCFDAEGREVCVALVYVMDRVPEEATEIASGDWRAHAEPSAGLLHLTLKRRWFDEIANGEKRNEYREAKPFWNARLASGGWTRVLFRNGYSKTAPTMLCTIDEPKLVRDDSGTVAVWRIPIREVLYVHR